MSGPMSESELRQRYERNAPAVDVDKSWLHMSSRMAERRRGRRGHRRGYRAALVASAIVIALGGLSVGVLEAVAQLNRHSVPIVIGGDNGETSTSATGASTPSTSVPPVTTAGTSVPATTASTSVPVTTTSAPVPAGSIQYRNTEYGFTLTLPESWQGYSILTQQWEGYPQDAATGTAGAPVHGPQLLVRHPKWTASAPRQDIPIMVFTLAQWEQVQQARLTVSAAPIPPTELGRNSIYVFALPARYNYAFPTGWEEVDKILRGQPLRGIEPASATSSTSPLLSTTYEITEADNGKTFTYTVTSRFSVILDQTRFPPGNMVVSPSRVVGGISNVPSVAPPLYAERYEGLKPGTCTIRNGTFGVTVTILPLSQ